MHRVALYVSYGACGIARVWYGSGVAAQVGDASGSGGRSRHSVVAAWWGWLLFDAALLCFAFRLLGLGLVWVGFDFSGFVLGWFWLWFGLSRFGLWKGSEKKCFLLDNVLNSGKSDTTCMFRLC